MITLSPHTLKHLRKGHTATTHTTHPHHKHRTYRAHTGKTTIRVKVLEAEPDPNGGWTLTIRLHQPPETIRYLAGDPGANRDDYTTNPIRSAREPTGGPVEAIKPDPRKERLDPNRHTPEGIMLGRASPFKRVKRS